MIDPDAERPPPLPRTTEPFARRLATVVKWTILFIPCELLLMGLLASLGIPIGNAGGEQIEELGRQGAFQLLAFGVLLMPPLEELAFRWLPSQLSDIALQRRGGARWSIGLPATLAFALVHNLVPRSGGAAIPLTSHLQFSLEIVPASQFLFGLLLWHFMRRYGLWASVTSHMIHNFVLLSFASFAPEVPR